MLSSSRSQGMRIAREALRNKTVMAGVDIVRVMPGRERLEWRVG